ncbi:DUF3823 domain-containing protein [Dysgonomonas sp. HDW5B]|uniref:DUF3823 domain-containing protein n=1 Tax=Dysgonomonas sp. HDW5B TaxID=2714927 RepID=UPI0014095560|nr:DUF3823 domain-containing protein [Dysgonomonas sp. HDW5B]QIK54432.1 DUF3823 domain-containing protein [Dysgonomonas sp. HDW5B]
MKKTICSFSIISLLILFSSCGKDNYDEPESTLTGRITYNGEAINVRGTDERVRLQLYQDGYDKHDPIEVFVGQEGTFSAKLFNGQYKMVTRNNNGPWVNTRDTTLITVSGSTTIEFKVTPYFTISNAEISLSGNTMNASLTINRIVPTAEIDRVILLLNSTTFVDDGFNVLRKDFTGNDVKTGQINYTAELNEKALNAKFLFGRICVWTKGADQGIYSQVVKLK